MATWIWLIICAVCFVLGGWCKATIEALDPQLDAAIQAGDTGIMIWLSKIVHEVMGFFHKPKATPTTAPPAAPKPPAPPAAQ